MIRIQAEQASYINSLQHTVSSFYIVYPTEQIPCLCIHGKISFLFNIMFSFRRDYSRIRGIVISLAGIVLMLQRAQILQIEIDPAEINKNVIVDHSIIGDVKSVLQELNPRVDEKEHPAWLAEVEALKNRYPLKYDGDRLTGPYVLQELYRITKGDALIVTEVGQNQMWAAQYYKYREPRTFLTSGGLGTMGYGLGASLGAKLGRPDKLVVNVAGDGCFRMNMNEIATAARYNIPVIQLVLNNHVLGMVRQWQTLFYGKRYSATVLNDQVDFVKLAEALGAVGMRVTKREEVAPALEKAIALGRPVVIDCVIDSDDKVFPMMPAGAPLEATFDADDMIKENK